MTRGLRPLGEPSSAPYRPLNTTATEASSGPGSPTAPADPPPSPRTAAKAKHAEKEAQRRAYPVPIGGPDSPRHKFRTLRQDPENALLQDKQFEGKYGLPNKATVQILGPQSGERKAGTRSVSEAIRNSILANGGPDVGFNPKGDLDYRRKVLMIAPELAVAPDPTTAAGKSIDAEREAQRRAYPVPIGVPDSPRYKFRALRQDPENGLLTDVQFEKKYSLPSRITRQILGPKSGERNAGTQGVSEATRKSILANGGPDIGFNPRGSMDRRRKALFAAAAAEVPRAEAAAQDPVLGASASSALPDSPPRGVGEGPAKRPRLDPGLHAEPSMSDPFMAHPYPFAGPYRPDEAGPSSRPLPPFRESPGSGERPAAAPQGGGHRSPSPDPEQGLIDTILQSFKDY